MDEVQRFFFKGGRARYERHYLRVGLDQPVERIHLDAVHP